MKRIVWIFGDGHTMYTALDSFYRLPKESEAQQLERYKRTYPAKHLPTNIRPDGVIRGPEEQAAYVAGLGEGAVMRFAGLIDDAEYMDKFSNLRAFREAWTWTTDDPVIDIDIGKCRERKRGDLRRQRAPILDALDIEYQRADEHGDAAKKAEIAARKQALRDVTKDPAIDAAQTPDALLKFVPECLA